MSGAAPAGRAITGCRVCDSTRLEPALDLGLQPWCNHFLTAEEVGHEPFYPLHVVHCADCQMLQLDFTVPKEVMFSDHTYLSGVTRSLGEHFREVAAEVDAAFWRDTPGKSVLDIGSNDGTQLRGYRDLGYDVLGVESSAIPARMANEAGLTTVRAFFDQDLVARLGRRFHVINAAGVFFHLEDLHSVTEGIREALREDGVFVIQFLYLKRIVENLAFDQIYHEHLLYYNLATIERLLARHGLALFDARLAPIHGGSIIAYAGHAGHREPTERLRTMQAAEDEAGSNELETFRAFARRIEAMKADNLTLLDGLKAEGKRVFGFGAPAKGNTLLNYFGIGPERLEVLVEKNPLRRGLFSPGRHIPIVIEGEYDVPDVYYVLAWNFKREILANNQALVDQGVEFVFPVDPEGEGGTGWRDGAAGRTI